MLRQIPENYYIRKKYKDMNPFILALMTAGIFVFVTKLNKYQDDRAERNRTIDLAEDQEPELSAHPLTQSAGLGRYHEQSPYGLSASASAMEDPANLSEAESNSSTAAS